MNHTKGSRIIRPNTLERARATVSPESTDGSNTIQIHALNEIQSMETESVWAETN